MTKKGKGEEKTFPPPPPCWPDGARKKNERRKRASAHPLSWSSSALRPPPLLGPTAASSSPFPLHLQAFIPPSSLRYVLLYIGRANGASFLLPPDGMTRRRGKGDQTMRNVSSSSTLFSPSEECCIEGVGRNAGLTFWPCPYDDDGQQQAAGPLLVLLHCGRGRIKCPLQAFIRCVSLCLSPLSHFQYTFSFSFVVLSENDLPSTMAFLWYNPPPSEFPFVPSSRRIRHSWRVKDIAIIRTASCRKKNSYTQTMLYVWCSLANSPRPFYFFITRRNRLGHGRKEEHRALNPFRTNFFCAE